MGDDKETEVKATSAKKSRRKKPPTLQEILRKEQEERRRAFEASHKPTRLKRNEVKE